MRFNMLESKPITKAEQVPYHTHNGIDSPRLQATGELKEFLENIPQTAISSPSGGLNIDPEARATINQILTALRNAKIIET